MHRTPPQPMQSSGSSLQHGRLLAVAVGSENVTFSLLLVGSPRRHPDERRGVSCVQSRLSVVCIIVTSQASLDSFGAWVRSGLRLGVFIAIT